MIDGLIEKYKQVRKQGYLKLDKSYKYKYAFVGVGNHSISNLYPCLNYLAVPLKIICTRNKENAVRMASRYGAEGTDSLTDIINDVEIKGVFVSASVKAHYEITKKLMQGGKYVFVEKPPCASKNELEDLIKNANQVKCLVGLQKRYCKINSLLKPYLKDVITYNARYVTGGYPEGDEVLDLYIHALDNIYYLFGKTEHVNIQRVGAQGYSSVIIQTKHRSGAIGVLELSTNYGWGITHDDMTINTKKEVIYASYPSKLTKESKPKKVMNIPLEKVLDNPTKTISLYDNRGFIPIKDFNSLYEQGYLTEIETFVKTVEGQKTTNRSPLNDLLETYSLIEKIKHKF
ncbi:MAG TPA: Gfo/Idh/MocA family protein [Cyclobacteriaceae bacterium]